jgi:hypothetical protein
MLTIIRGTRTEPARIAHPARIVSMLTIRGVRDGSRAAGAGGAAKGDS